MTSYGMGVEPFPFLAFEVIDSFFFFPLFPKAGSFFLLAADVPLQEVDLSPLLDCL